MAAFDYKKETSRRNSSPKWLKLDNAAKIFPASMRKNWSNVFRLSVTFTENIDRIVLSSALDVVVKHFPSVTSRLRRGMFWYYLEEIPFSPEIMDEKSYPLDAMSLSEIKKCAFRVIVFENRMAVEFFHALTDGTGGLIFIKNLAAEYITQKYHIDIPNTDGIYDRYDEPNECELEDSFFKYSGQIKASRKEKTPYHINGTPEEDGYRTNTALIMNESEVVDLSKSYGVTVTAFLSAVMIKAVMSLQDEVISDKLKQKPVKIQIPVNLRKLFKSETLRNFVLCASTEADPRLGEYDLKELSMLSSTAISIQTTPKFMASKIATNVQSEKNPIIRVVPLFLKNIIMKAIFDVFGERKACFSLSNLGEVNLPDAMCEYIQRMDFILGVQARSPYNCGVISYGGKLYLNFIRNIKEPLLEQKVVRILKSLKLNIKAESNSRYISSKAV